MVLAYSFQVVLFLCVTQSVQIMSVEDHPFVVEGVIVLTCSGLSDSSQERNLQWMTTKPGANPGNVAICESTERNCHNYDSRYNVSASFTDKHYTTSLTILSTSQYERYMTINCTLYEEEKDWSYGIQSWNMSEIVHPLENFTCNAVNNPADKTVHISCSTLTSFPRIICEGFEVDDSNKELPLTTPKIEYGYEESSTAGYRKAKCSLVTGLSKPGILKYKVEVYPVLGDNNLVNDAARNPEVFLKSSPVCENNKTTRLVCTSSWLPAPANLIWFKNTTLISNITTTTTFKDGFYTSQSSVELHNLSPDVGPIRCQANYLPRDSSQNQTIQTQLLVNTSVPSVFFTYNGMLLGKRLVLEEGKLLGKFECRVNGGDPVVDAVLVVCQILDNVTNFPSLTRSVEFDIPQVTSKDTGTCYCSASQCNNQKVNFTFSFGYPAHSQQTFERRQSESYINNIYYIIAGFFVLVFLVFFLAIIMFLVRRWDKLYTYVYGRFYCQSQTQVKHMLNGDYHHYSVANDVANNALTFMPDELLESENFVGNHRTSISSSSSNHSHVYSNVDSDELYSECADIPLTLHQSPVETNIYNNLNNSDIHKLATTPSLTVSGVVQDKPIKSSRFSQPSDLVADSLKIYAKTRIPPKPCRNHRRPDLLLHRPSLSPQTSSSDDEQQSRIIYELPQQVEWGIWLSQSKS